MRLPFPTPVPPSLATQAALWVPDAPVPRERGSEAGGEGTREGGGGLRHYRANPRPGTETGENEIYSNYPGQKTSGTSLPSPPLPPSSFPRRPASPVPFPFLQHWLPPASPGEFGGRGKPRPLLNCLEKAGKGKEFA